MGRESSMMQKKESEAAGRTSAIVATRERSQHQLHAEKREVGLPMLKR